MLTTRFGQGRTHVNRRLVAVTVIGAVGSGLIAIAADLPGSHYGAELGARWPFSAGGAAPEWEGPIVTSWANAANNALPAGRLLPLLVVVGGVALLTVGWIRLIRLFRVGEVAGLGRVALTVGVWVLPLLFAAPFSSQDVWLYGAEGRAMLSGLSGSGPAAQLGHSMWLAGVDPRWALRPSMYGPGALDLSALFVRLSAGQPWVAAEYWRFADVLSLIVCALAIQRCVECWGGNATSAVLWGVANPGVLIMAVASIHNDAVMVAIVASGIAMAASARPILAVGLCALALTVKAPAALALLGVAWYSGRTARGRSRLLLIAAGTALVGLFVTGLPAGGGFGWLHGAAPATVASGFAVSGLLGSRSAPVAGVLQIAGLGCACLLVLRARSPGRLPRSLGMGFAVLALAAATAQPWYLVWPLVFLAASGVEVRGTRFCMAALISMMAWSELPFGTRLWGFGLSGLLLNVALTWLADRLPRVAECTGVHAALTTWCSWMWATEVTQVRPE